MVTAIKIWTRFYSVKLESIKDLLIQLLLKPIECNGQEKKENVLSKRGIINKKSKVVANITL